MRAAKKALLLILLPLLSLLLGLEGLGALMLEDPHNPTAVFNTTFYEYDPELVVRLRPNLRQDFKAIRPDVDATATTNSDGFRGPEWTPPDPDAFRILVFGDSVTFGLAVNDDEAWPAVMARLLQAAAGGRQVQLRNLAVPGYSTLQGRVLYERHALAGDYRPHFVVFAFGFNDGYLRPHDDEHTRQGERFLHDTWQGSSRQLLVEHSRFFRWIWQPGPLEPRTTRVPAGALRDNLQAVGRAATGFDLLLVDAGLPHTYARDAVAETAAALGLPWLAFREVFRQRRGLAAEGRWPDGGRVRLAVQSHGIAIPPDPAGGPAFAAVVIGQPERRPRARRVTLRDDGEQGDLIGADGIWSGVVEIAAGERPEIAFSIPGLQGSAASGDGILQNSVHLLQPGPRRAGEDGLVTVDVTLPNLPPWPELVLVPDPIHASPAGCVVLAEAVAKSVRAGAAWQDFVR